jgi:hypothetical protein
MVRLALTKLVALLRGVRRVLTPPGNRGSLDSSYRQPNGDGTKLPSEMGAAQHGHDVTF